MVIPAECLWYDSRGRAVNVCHPNTASGVYQASNEAVTAMNEQGTNVCPEGVRPRRVVIKGLPGTATTPAGYIRGCGAMIYQEDMPDVHVIDWQYRIYVNIGLACLIVLLIGAITVKVLK